MKKTNKILLSTIATLILLLNGCGGGGTETGADIGIENPIPPIAEIPTEPGVTDPTEPEVTDPILPVDPYKTAGWYGKTQVTATANDGKVYKHTTSGVFGELLQSDEGKDQHDIKSYGPAILQVVFPQTEWADEDNGYYFSNYKNYSVDASDKKVWTFEIRHDIPYDSVYSPVDLKTAPITISLDGVFDVKYLEKDGRVEYKESTDVNQTILNDIHLVDVDNGYEYTVAELQTADLKMDGKTVRTFKWVLGTVDSSDYQKTQIPMSKSASFVQEKTEDTFTTQTEDAPQLGGKFGLPPQ